MKIRTSSFPSEKPDGFKKMDLECYNKEDTFLAIKKGSVPMLKNCLEAGTDPDSIINGHTLLGLAVIFAKYDLIECLIEYGADVNKKDDDGCSPLFNLIVTYCINFNTQDSMEIKQQLASINTYFNILKKLIDSGADINSTDSCGDTPISVAILNKKYELASRLVQYGVDPNFIIENKTLLMHAVLTGDINFVKVLVEMGATIDDIDKNGNSAKSFASSLNKLEILEFLTSFGSKS